jgi:dipeptidase E
MKLLLLSNSTNAGESYLFYPKNHIQRFLGEKPVQALFIPYAAVTFSFDEYEKKVKERFQEIGHDIVSIHHFKNPEEAVLQAKAIVVGGGNTFQLLHLLQKSRIVEAIRKKVLEGKPYIGWSAGSNVACPTICTTNDMPIVETDGLQAFNLVPFQINPHYTDVVAPNFSGETRDQRIAEYLAANHLRTVVGLREGTMFLLDNHVLKLVGPHKAKIFKLNDTPYELGEKDDFSFLLNI